MTSAELHELEALLAYLKRAHGVDFTGYKRTSLSRRVCRRLTAVQLNTIAEYRRYLEMHADELPMLLDTILIKATGFFRDQDAWQALAHRVIMRLARREGPIRIWSAGCASGQEVCTIAILLNEFLGEKRYREQVTLYATDIDAGALEQLRHARYGAQELAAVPDVYRARYFEASGRGFLLRGNLRESFVIERSDLLRESPPAALDLLICRNTMIYFNIETRMKLVSRLHGSLKEGGHLFLGDCELPLTQVRMFRPIDARSRIFAKVEKVSLRDPRLQSSLVRHASGGQPAYTRGADGAAGDMLWRMRHPNHRAGVDHARRVSSDVHDVFPFADCERASE